MPAVSLSRETGWSWSAPSVATGCEGLRARPASASHVAGTGPTGGRAAGASTGLAVSPLPLRGVGNGRRRTGVPGGDGLSGPPVTRPGPVDDVTGPLPSVACPAFPATVGACGAPPRPPSSDGLCVATGAGGGSRPTGKTVASPSPTPLGRANSPLTL